VVLIPFVLVGDAGVAGQLGVLSSSVLGAIFFSAESGMTSGDWVPRSVAWGF
jgi:hypothetical protein